MAWVRDPYIKCEFLDFTKTHPDFHKQVVISGHTSTGLISGKSEHVILTDTISRCVWISRILEN